MDKKLKNSPTLMQRHHSMQLLPRSSAWRPHLVSYMVCALFCSGALLCRAEGLFSFATTPGELPKGVIPHAYRLDIAPDLERLSFTGREEIDVDVAHATDVITVNAVGLTITQVTLAE